MVGKKPQLENRDRGWALAMGTLPSQFLSSGGVVCWSPSVSKCAERKTHPRLILFVENSFIQFANLDDRARRLDKAEDRR